MASPPFKVKALFEYNSPHDDDLSFPLNQIITVTEEEDADWYIGEYTDASGALRSGLFPRNFVERYEPAPPPRPVRASRPKQSEVAAPPEPTPVAPAAPQPAEGDEDEDEEDEEPQHISQPVAKTASPPEAHEPPLASKPVVAVPATTPLGKGPPPPVAAKSSSFRDRIAAFNKPAAAPIAPFKPGGTAASTFIKKPFVAPPPSRNAYVPPPKEAAPQKIYRREEDPEIAERRRQDQEDAEKAGLAPAGDDGEEEAPKAISLKERIALLQKQQAEQAARRTGQTSQDQSDKPKRPSKPRTESHEQREAHAGEAGEIAEHEAADEDSDEHEPAPPRLPRVPTARETEPISENDADQSAAGELTEEAEGDNGGVAEGRQRHPATTVKVPVSEDEEDEEGVEEEDGEEEEVDEEARHQLALRERMAKLSGGMGMAGMFGPPGGMPMPGIAGGAMKKRRPAVEKPANDDDDDPVSQPARVTMVPMPGIGRAPTDPPARRDTDNHPITGSRGPEEVPDVEDITPVSQSRAQGAPRAVPLPPHTERDAHSSQPAARGAPPVPGSRPSMDQSSGRPAPPPPPVTDIASPSPGSESDDEMPASALAEQPLPIRTAPPPVPHHRPRTPSGDDIITSPVSPQGRAPPPIPMSPPSQGRAPPPPPQGRPGTTDSLHRKAMGLGAGVEGESEYEGDYDTDIASTDKHKEALKAHSRNSSLDESTTAETTPTKPSHPLPPLPGLPGSLPRGVPPPPPSQPPPSRMSADIPRAPPPLPSPRQEDDDDYDPYRYTDKMAASKPPAPPARQPSSRAPAPPAEDDSDMEEDEQQYQHPPARKSMDRPPPPLPPQGPPHERSAPPPPPVGGGSPALSSGGFAPLPRRSTDAEHALGGSKRSMEVPRHSMDHGVIAQDVDLGESSQWWTQSNTPPPVFQNRRDVLIEYEPESTSTKRGGKTTISKDVYVLFQDYSQTVISVRFDAKMVDDVALEQRHEAPPNRLRQDQLEEAHTRFGAHIAQEVESKQNTTVGDATPQALIQELLRPFPTALSPVGTRAYGALVYANFANATVQQYDEIRPGDVVTFRNAKLQGKHGAMHAKYSLDVGKPDHVGIVADWDGTKKKIRVWEQGREKGKVKAEGFKLSDLRSGEVKVWRVMPRSWIGWES